MHQINAIITIAYRDFIKFLRDKPRIAATFIFPFIFIGVLGGSLNANLSDQLGYSLLTFTFTGVLAQTLFQSTAAGIISLIEDRENDFSQEIFVSPISRYSIVLGKIIGESMVACAQALGVLIFGFIIGVDMSLSQILTFIPAGIAACLLGGAFGVIVMSNLSNQRSANQIFPFLLFPQFFLAGVFSPIKELPWYLFILSRISPMTYAVDFLRGLFYQGRPEYDSIVLMNPSLNLLIISGIFVICLIAGTFLFVRNERNR